MRAVALPSTSPAPSPFDAPSDSLRQPLLPRGLPSELALHRSKTTHLNFYRHWSPQLPWRKASVLLLLVACARRGLLRGSGWRCRLRTLLRLTRRAPLPPCPPPFWHRHRRLGHVARPLLLPLARLLARRRLHPPSGGGGHGGGGAAAYPRAPPPGRRPPPLCRGRSAVDAPHHAALPWALHLCRRVCWDVWGRRRHCQGKQQERARVAAEAHARMCVGMRRWQRIPARTTPGRRAGAPHAGDGRAPRGCCCHERHHDNVHQRECSRRVHRIWRRAGETGRNVCACVRACMRACVRACVRARVRACSSNAPRSSSRRRPAAPAPGAHPRSPTYTPPRSPTSKPPLGARARSGTMPSRCSSPACCARLWARLPRSTSTPCSRVAHWWSS